MMESSAIEQLIERVRAAARSSGAMVLNASLSYESEHVPIAAVDAEIFPELVEFIKPKLVYISPMIFDVASLVRKSLDTDENALLSDQEEKKLISKWRKHDGSTCGVSLELVFDGVIHGAVERVNWLTNFENETKLLVEEIEHMRLHDEREQTVNIKLQLSENVKQLMADPRFSSSRVGIAKRTTLAEALFPNLDHESIQLVVEQAEKEHWLATAGRKT